MCDWRSMVWCLIVVGVVQSAGAQSLKYDVVVYGATPSGIAAAVAAADDGARVLLVEPTERIGGLVTCGLSHTDFRSFEGLSGAFLDFTKRVEEHYRLTYGENSPQQVASFRGTFGEPKVNLQVLEEILAEQLRIEVRLGERLEGVTMEESADPVRKRIKGITLIEADGGSRQIAGAVFVDATYEGDLMAEAGVPWRVGREGRDEYGESLAPEKPDLQLQAYNFRWVMTQDEDLRVLPEAPAGYRREEFLAVLPMLASGKLEKIFGYPSRCLFKAQTPMLPNGKYDINDVSKGLIRLSLPGLNAGWPDGDEATRRENFAAHLRDQLGLLYFLQNDAEVPERFRTEARSWGFCRDEFDDSRHLLPQLYVREARRMVGKYVYRQADAEHAQADARAIFHADAIAMGDYGHNCHGTGHEGPRFGGTHTGEFYQAVPPYQIPYGVLIADTVDNLLVSCAVSSTHVGFCSLRLEPIWMSLGQAVGHAAAQAMEEELRVQQIDVGRLQRRLHEAGSATIYVSDVAPDNEDFAAVQWWGSLGGWHGLESAPEGNPRGKLIHGQYYEAFVRHAANLDEPLTDALRTKWSDLARQSGVEIGEQKLKTRREFLQFVYRERGRGGR